MTEQLGYIPACQPPKLWELLLEAEGRFLSDLLASAALVCTNFKVHHRYWPRPHKPPNVPSSVLLSVVVKKHRENDRTTPRGVENPTLLRSMRRRISFVDMGRGGGGAQCFVSGDFKSLWSECNSLRSEFASKPIANWSYWQSREGETLCKLKTGVTNPVRTIRLKLSLTVEAWTLRTPKQ